MVDEHGVNTLGVKLVAGRNFNAGDVSARTKDDKGSLHSVIITQALADKLFPGGAVGKTLYSSLPGKDGPVTVVGVVERLQAPWVGWDKVEQAMLVPQYDHGEFDDSSARYLIRTEPGRRDEVMKEAERKLGEVNTGRIVRGLRSIEEVRGESYRQDRAMTMVLTTVIFALLARHRPGHRRHGQLLGHAPHQADRHAPRARRAPLRHPPLLHDREPDRRRHRRRARPAC